MKTYKNKKNSLQKDNFHVSVVEESGEVLYSVFRAKLQRTIDSSFPLNVWWNSCRNGVEMDVRIFNILFSIESLSDGFKVKVCC